MLFLGSRKGEDGEFEERTGHMGRILKAGTHPLLMTTITISFLK